MFIMKSGIARVLACRMSSPPLLMFKCVMRLAYVGKFSECSMLRSVLRKDVTILS